MVLLRHGATEWSQSGQHTGRTDIPLLDIGREQAKAAGELLRGMTFAQVITSPLQRASTTCALAGFEGHPEPDLMEWDYGAYEGRTTAQICGERPGWTLWSDGVVDGERAADVGRRVDRVIEQGPAARRRHLVRGPRACPAGPHRSMAGVATRRRPTLRPVHRHREHPRLGTRAPGDPELERGTVRGAAASAVDHRAVGGAGSCGSGTGRGGATRRR